MATKTTKGSGGDDNAEAALTDEEYDSAYEDDLLELVERLARRRGRPRHRPAPADSDAAADAASESASESASDVDAEAANETDPNANNKPDADPDPEARPTVGSGPESEPDAKTEAKTRAESKAESKARPEARTGAGAKSRPSAKAGVDTEGEDAEDRSGSAGVGGDPAARRIRVLTILSVALATALAAVSTFAFMQWREYGSGSSPQVARQKVAERAGEIVGTLFTYDYHDAKGYLQKQAAVMTKSAAAAVRPNWATLTTLFETGKYVSTAQIEQVYVGDISGNKASVIVVVNNKLITSQGIQNSVGATLQFGLAKENGVWLANAVPKLESTGVQTNTDLQGKPLQPASPTPAPTPTK
jgi:hypothetical protein